MLRHRTDFERRSCISYGEAHCKRPRHALREPKPHHWTAAGGKDHVLAYDRFQGWVGHLDPSVQHFLRATTALLKRSLCSAGHTLQLRLRLATFTSYRPDQSNHE
jgi:hypothetical protein